MPNAPSPRKVYFCGYQPSLQELDPPGEVDHSLVNVCYFTLHSLQSPIMHRNKNKNLPYIFFFLSSFISTECLSWRRCHDSAVRMGFLCFHICKGWSQGWGKLVFFPPIFSVLVLYQLLLNTLPTIRPQAPHSRILYCYCTQLSWKPASLSSPNPNTQMGDPVAADPYVKNDDTRMRM